MFFEDVHESKHFFRIQHSLLSDLIDFYIHAVKTGTFFGTFRIMVLEFERLIKCLQISFCKTMIFLKMKRFKKERKAGV